MGRMRDENWAPWSWPRSSAAAALDDRMIMDWRRFPMAIPAFRNNLEQSINTPVAKVLSSTAISETRFRKGPSPVSWKQDLIDKMTDVLRFTLRACLFIDLFLFAVFSVWFSVMFVWHLMCWLDRVMFGSPW